MSGGHVHIADEVAQQAHGIIYDSNIHHHVKRRNNRWDYKRAYPNCNAFR